MNQLGSAARNYYRDYLPGQYASISDPEEFFTQLGQRLDLDVSSLASALAGPDLPEETYLQKVGRLNMARSQAAEQVLAEQVYSLAPEYDEVDQTDLSEATQIQLELMNTIIREFRDQD
jgi:hypothetical protein